MWNPFRRKRYNELKMGHVIYSRMSQEDFDSMLRDLEHDYLSCWCGDGCVCHKDLANKG